MNELINKVYSLIVERTMNELFKMIQLITMNELIIFLIQFIFI